MHEEGPAEIGRVGDVDPLAVQERAAASPRGEEIARDGIVDDAHGDLPVLLQRDQRGPDGNATDEVLGAIDRIDDPADVASSSAAELFAKHAVVGERAPEKLHDRPLGLAIGLGHRGVVRLQHDLEAAAVVLHRDLPGGAGRLDGGVECLLAHRDGSSAGNGSPRSASTCPYTSKASTTTGMPP